MGRTRAGIPASHQDDRFLSFKRTKIKNKRPANAGLFTAHCATRLVLQALHDFLEIIVAHHEVDWKRLRRGALDDAENDDAQVSLVLFLHQVIAEVDDVAHPAKTHDEFMDSLACLIKQMRIR